MVTETLPETQPEVAPATPQAEAPPVPAVVAPEAPSPEEPKDELDSFLETEGLTETPQPQAPPTDAPPLNEAEVDRRAAEKLATLDRQRQEAGVIMAFRDAAPRLRSYVRQYMAGQTGHTPQQFEDSVVNMLNAVNNQAKTVYQSDAAATYRSSQYSEAEKLVKGIAAKQTGHKSFGDFYKDLVELARDGYVPAKDADSIKKAAAAGAIEKLTKNEAALRAALSRLQAPKNSADAITIPGGAITKEWAETASVADLMKARAAGKL